MASKTVEIFLSKSQKILKLLSSPMEDFEKNFFSFSLISYILTF
jgi:hypothetical protein